VGSRKWMTIANNEYRVQTGRVRSIRRYIPLILIAALAFHTVYLAPAIVSLFVNDAIAFLLSQVALAGVQLTLLITFFYFMIIPLSDTLREEKSGQLEILLCSPIKPSDLLLGHYLGQLPIYGLFVAAFAAFFAAILAPVGLDMAQIAIVIAIFIITSLSAFWIGVVSSALLRSRLEKIAAGKDLGKAIAMMLPLPMVAVLYAAMGGGLLESIASPEGNELLRSMLELLPSSWGAQVVIDFAANPGNIAPVALKASLRLGGLGLFFLAAIYVGMKLADRAYNLEQTSISSSKVGKDGSFYRAIRAVGGRGSFAVLLLSIFKDYGRRLENISNVTYILGILVLMNIFIIPQSESPGSGPPGPIMASLFLYPIIVVMITGEVTVEGRETLFIYRKAPSGVVRYLKAMLAKGWLVLAPVAGIPTLIISYIQPGSTLSSSLMTAALIVFIMMGNVAFVLGLFLVNPAFSSKSAKIGLNVILVIFAQIGFFLFSMLILTNFGSLDEPVGGFPLTLLTHGLLSWASGFGFLMIGKARLHRID
jgi:hypothetical protein